MAKDQGPVAIKGTRRGRDMATLRDVAQHAGVSHTTVSRVINAENSVQDSTRQRVHASIKALLYSPDPAARKLASTRDIRIGIPYGISTSAYLSELMLGTLEQCRLSGCHLRFEKCADQKGERNALKHLIDAGSDGLILPPPLCDSHDVLAMVVKAGTPAVLITSGVLTPYFSSVSINECEAAREMTHYLLSRGHRRIAFIKGHPAHSASDQRLRGFKKAMTEAGLPVTANQVAQGFFTYRSGLEAAERLFTNGFHPTAIFASNDDMASATVAMAHRRGMDVPKDVAVAGFDDTPFASMLSPGLTTVRRPISAMAREAVRLLQVQVRASKSGKPEPVEHKQLHYALVKRDSA